MVTRLLTVILSAVVLAFSAVLGVAVARADGCQGYNGTFISTNGW